MNHDNEFDYWLRRAEGYAAFSPDPSTKCGAVIVNNGLVGLGWNDFPKGLIKDVVQTPERWNNRELKYQLVVHAELNALLHAGHHAKGGTLFNHPPGCGPSCDRCAAAVIQAGIVRIVYRHKDHSERWKEVCERATWMYHEAGVEVIRV